MSAENQRGYGSRCRLLFHGEGEKYELWEVKFLGYLRTVKLHDVVTADEPTAEKNAQVFAELVQLLDDTSLSLVIRDAKDKGKEALAILRNHYLGSSKPRIISLYTTLTSMKLAGGENVTDYMIKAETASASLKSAGETISDSLLIAMVLKGLPQRFETFCTVTTQRKDPMNFQEFKTALRSYEESDKCQNVIVKSEDSVMYVKPGERQYSPRCFSCNQLGHKANQCPNKVQGKSEYKSNRWCENCKSPTHDTKWCRSRKKHAVKLASESNEKDDSDDHSFAMKVGLVQGVQKGFQSSENNSILVDSGSSTHIITDKSKFIKFDEKFVPLDHVIELADGSRQNGVAQGRGNASVKLCDSSGKLQKVLLQDALYIPSYNSDIFSVRAATKSGASVIFTPKYSKLTTKDGTSFEFEDTEKLYFLNKITTGNKKKNSHTLQQWHNILGHCNVKDVLKLEGVVKGMHISSKSDFDCETCTLGKMTQYMNRAPDSKAENSLESIHCDIAGPVTPEAREGFRYAINFIDDYSGATFVYFLKNKSDAVKALERFLADSSPYGVIKRFRRDNALEFTSAEFDSVLVKNKIKSELSCPYSPHQNGTAERSWRTLFEMARCLLIESGLPKNLWTYAVKTAAYIRNRCYNPRLEITPFEALTGKVPTLSNMHTFGTECFAYVQNKKKLDHRCEKGILLGYDSHSPAYLVYFAKEGNIKKVRCVAFNDKYTEKVDIPKQMEVYHPCIPMSKEQEENIQPEEIENEKENAQPKRRYPDRDRRQPKHLENFVTSNEGDTVDAAKSTLENFVTSDEGDTVDAAKSTIHYCYRISPDTYEEVIQSPEAKQWQAAMEKEIRLLKENNTFEETTLPDDREVIGGKWVFKVKEGPRNEEQLKARYVAKGYAQVKGVDYKETFSPTPKLITVRMMANTAVQSDLIIHQMDVDSAYLNAEIDTEIYVEQPKGFVKTDRTGRKLVWKLNKSLYGLKQSGRNWNNLLHKCLINENFNQSFADPCLYTKFEGDSTIIILFWVDDIIIAASNYDLLNSVKRNFHNMFKMKDLGELSWFLGIEFSLSHGNIIMNQTKYCLKILDRFKMSDCKPKSIPCDASVNTMNNESHELADHRLYREIVGSLIYLMIATRPDICYAVTKLSQHMSKPTKAHLGLAKHVLRYIKGTLDFSLKFTKSNDPLKLTGFCDSDWGSSDDRRSITGYCYKLNTNGPLISWKSQKQRIVALSSCEAEYVSLTSAVQEGKFLSQLYADMNNCDKNIVILYVDNQGAIALAKNPVFHQRSKHIDIRYHYIRLEVDNKNVELIYVPSEENVADIFTKPLTKKNLQKFCIIRGETLA